MINEDINKDYAICRLKKIWGSNWTLKINNYLLYFTECTVCKCRNDQVLSRNVEKEKLRKSAKAHETNLCN